MPSTGFLLVDKNFTFYFFTFIGFKFKQYIWKYEDIYY